MNQEFVELLLDIKAKGRLKPEYLAMSDEEYLKDFERRLRERRARTGNPSRALIDED